MKTVLLLPVAPVLPRYPHRYNPLTLGLTLPVCPRNGIDAIAHALHGRCYADGDLAQCCLSTILPALESDRTANGLSLGPISGQYHQLRN